MMTGRSDSCPLLPTTPDLLCGIVADCFDSSGMAIHLRGEKHVFFVQPHHGAWRGCPRCTDFFQIAYSGFEVTTYDISDAALKQALQRFDGIAAAYPTEVAGATEAAAHETIERIRFTSELASALQGTDLVIEAVPENLELKRDVFARIAAFAPPAAVRDELVDSTSERPDGFDWSSGSFSGAALRQPHLGQQHCRGDGFA